MIFMELAMVVDLGAATGAAHLTVKATLTGWLLGVRFEVYIESVDHWVAFVLLSVIGAGMIRESRGDEEEQNDDFGVRTMLLLAELAGGVILILIGLKILLEHLGLVQFPF